MEGKAEAKSSKIQAPLSSVSEVIMEAVSKCSKLVSIDLPGRNPCCLGSIHWERCSSQRFLAAEATMRLSQFTMLSGRVLLRVYALVPVSVVVVDFFGRQMRVLWLYW